MLETINNNNDSQTTNYKELSSQMDKTLKDMNSFIEKLSKENDTQYKELTKQTEEFQTKLNEYLETFNSELNATIKEDIDGVNTHLDTVQSDIATTKSEITNLLNQINAGQTQDLQEKFEAVQKHLNDMTAHYDEVLADITALINKLSEQNAQEFEDTINKLTSVQTDLTTLNNNIAQNMNETLSDMQADYTKQITDLQTNVNSSFENVNVTLNQMTENMNTGNDDISNQIKALENKVDQSFTSVSNGKKKLVATLLTYDIKVNKAASIESFDEINEAIKLLGDAKVAGDTIIQESVDTVTADKILAGQNVMINNRIINGTATSDANAIADGIVIGNTAYVNGQKITGTNKGYAIGYADGLASRNTGANITYVLVHQHVDVNGTIHTNDTDYVTQPGGCYTKKGTYKSYEQVDIRISHRGYGENGCYNDCYSYDSNGEIVGTHHCGCEDKAPVYGYVDRVCYYADCGHTWHDSEGTTTDINNIKPTQSIQKVEIQMY